MKKKRKTVPSAPDMMLSMKGAFYDLWLDTEERPRIPAAHKQVRRLLVWHLGKDFEKMFVSYQKSVDIGLKKDDIDGIIIPAQNQLRRIYEALFERIFCVRPKKGE